MSISRIFAIVAVACALLLLPVLILGGVSAQDAGVRCHPKAHWLKAFPSLSSGLTAIYLTKKEGAAYFNTVNSLPPFFKGSPDEILLFESRGGRGAMVPLKGGMACGFFIVPRQLHRKLIRHLIKMRLKNRT